MFSFTNILLLFSAFQLILIGFVFLFFKKGNIAANKFLAFFLIAKSICFLTGLVPLFESTPGFSQFYLLLATVFDLLLGPLIYFYIKKSTFNQIKFDGYFLANFLPFVIGFTAVWVFCFPPFNFRTRNYFAYSLFGVFQFYSFIEFIVYSHFIIYSALSIKLLSTYKNFIKENYSFPNIKLLKWLQSLLGGFIFIWILNILDVLARFNDISGRIVFVLTIAGIFAFANMIVIIAVSNPEMFREKIPAVKRKYEKTHLSDEELGIYENKLNKIMNDEKIYLLPSLGLTDLAEKLCVQNHAASQIINTAFGKNFYDYINYYRVEDCKKLLISADNKSKTVLEIAFKCGFNSKSVFNEAFKKITGFTPTEYRKINLKN